MNITRENTTSRRNHLRELPGSGFKSRPDDVGAGGRALLVVERAIRRAVDRLPGLLPPALGERPVVERVVPDRCEELSGGALPGRAVAGDREGGAVDRARRAREVQQVLVEDVVERLHDLSATELLSQVFAAGERLVVEFRQLAVARRIVVAGVQDELA